MFFEEKINQLVERQADRIVWFFIAIYVALFTSLSILKLYSFSYYDWDFASDLTVLWNSLNGRFLYYPFLEQNIFGAHLYLIIILILPFYAIFHHPVAILFLQSLFFGLAAYPLYKLAKEKIGSVFALLVSLLYLLYPSVGFINLFETHFEIYEIFFLFFAFYFFEKNKFFQFIGFLLLASMCKENVSLVVLMFGIYALFRRKTLKWILVPLCLGCAWFLISVKLVIPSLAKYAKLYQEGFIFSIYYKHLGSTMLEMATTVFFNPIETFKLVFTPYKLVYIFQLFLPVCFLSFFSPLPLLIAIPIFMQNLLSGAPTHARIEYQYVGLLIPFIFISVIFSIQKFLKYKFFIRNKILISIVLLFVSFVSGYYFYSPQSRLLSYFNAYKLGDEALGSRRLLNLIPADASVMATFKFLPFLSSRSDVYSFHFISLGYKMYTRSRYVPPENLEYLLIDFNDSFLKNYFFPEEAPENIRKFLTESDWKILAGSGNNILFKKGFDGGFILNGPVKNPEIKNVDLANFDGQVELLGHNIYDGNIANDRTLHLQLYWKKLADIVGPIGLFVFGVDEFGNISFVDGHQLGYGVFSPDIWNKEEIIEEQIFVLLPSKLKSGRYKINILLSSLSNNSVIQVFSSDKSEKFDQFYLGDMELEGF